MKLQITIVSALFFISSFNIYSQEQPTENQETKSNFWEKVNFGGNLGVNFGSNRTNIVIAPAAIYNFNNKIAAGTSISFGYNSFNDSFNTKLYNYGGSIIGLYNPSNTIQLSSEFEFTFINQTTKVGNEKLNTNWNYPSLFIGAGYRFKNIVVGARYDLLHQQNRSIFASAFNPFARVFF